MDKHKKNALLHSSVGGRRSVNVVRPSGRFVFFFFFLLEDNEFDGAEANEGLGSSCLTATPLMCSHAEMFFSINKP